MRNCSPAVSQALENKSCAKMVSLPKESKRVRLQGPPYSGHLTAMTSGIYRRKFRIKDEKSGPPHWHTRRRSVGEEIWARHVAARASNTLESTTIVFICTIVTSKDSTGFKNGVPLRSRNFLTRFWPFWSVIRKVPGRCLADYDALRPFASMLRRWRLVEGVALRTTHKSVCDWHRSLQSITCAKIWG